MKHTAELAWALYFCGFSSLVTIIACCIWPAVTYSCSVHSCIKLSASLVLFSTAVSGSWRLVRSSVADCMLNCNIVLDASWGAEAADASGYGKAPAASRGGLANYRTRPYWMDDKQWHICSSILTRQRLIVNYARNRQDCCVCGVCLLATLVFAMSYLLNWLMLVPCFTVVSCAR